MFPNLFTQILLYHSLKQILFFFFLVRTSVLTFTLTTLSTKNYEDFFTSNALMLPSKYKILLNKLFYINIILSTTHCKNNWHKFDHIKQYHSPKYLNNLFSEKYFQQIMLIVRYYYIYQHEKRLGTYRLQNRMKVRYYMTNNIKMI